MMHPYQYDHTGHYAELALWRDPFGRSASSDDSLTRRLTGCLLVRCLDKYSLPTIIFTGTEDTATPVSQCNLDKAPKSAYAWHHFEGATHAWEASTDGAGRPSVDDKCSKADNIYKHFPACRSDKYTATIRSEVRAFVEKNNPIADHPKVSVTSSPTSSDLTVEQRTEELLRELGGKQ